MQQQSLNCKTLSFFTQEKMDSLVLMTTFSPYNPDIKGIPHKHWNIIKHSVQTILLVPLVDFWRTKNLKDMLVMEKMNYHLVLVMKN